MSNGMAHNNNEPSTVCLRRMGLPNAVCASLRESAAPPIRMPPAPALPTLVFRVSPSCLLVFVTVHDVVSRR